MKYIGKTLLFSLVILAASVSQGMAAQLSVVVNSSGLSASADSGSIRLLVATPSDDVIEVSDEGYVSWSASGMANGSYRYDVIATDDDGGMDRDSGSFTISGGSIVIDAGEGDTSSVVPDANQDSGLLSRAFETVLNVIVPQAYAQNLTASSGVPTVTFTDTNAGADPNTWTLSGIESNEDEFRLTDTAESSRILEFESGASADTALAIRTDAVGDMTLAGSTIFIDRSANRLGINQTVPAQGIHATASSGKANLFVRLENTAESTWDMGQDQFGDMVMNIPTNGNGGPTGTMMRIADQSGQVSFPNGFAGQVRVTDAAGTDGSVQTLFNLINNGPPAFRFFDNVNNQTWQFRGAQNGSFFIDDPSTGTTEVEVRPGGTMRVGGALVQTSSRAKKQGFSDVDANEILNKVVDLDISAWSYKADPRASRHIGPVSEDFYAAFKLGDDSTGISPIDTAGVTFASIQALHSKVVDQQEKILNLESRLKELEGSTQRIEALEATLASLVSAQQLTTVAVVTSD